MKKIMGDTNSQKATLGPQARAKITAFLTETEKEPVPKHLEDLALELQHALNRKLDTNK